MPYPNAHLYVLALIPATLLGFWPTYFSDLGSGSAAFHFHGISATAWIVLVAFQSWSIHNRHVDRHRQSGMFSLALFPFFFAGFFMILQANSHNNLIGDQPLFLVVIGPSFGALSVIAIVSIAYLYYSGLKNRKNVQLHARYLLAIPFLFAESIFGRIFNNFVPGMIATDIDDIPLIYLGVHLSQILAIALAMYLYARAPRYGRPFLIVSGAMVLQSIALESLHGVVWWREIYLMAGQIPVTVTILMGVSLGVIISWLGWTAPSRLQVCYSATQQ